MRGGEGNKCWELEDGGGEACEEGDGEMPYSAPSSSIRARPFVADCDRWTLVRPGRGMSAIGGSESGRLVKIMFVLC